MKNKKIIIGILVIGIIVVSSIILTYIPLNPNFSYNIYEPKIVDVENDSFKYIFENKSYYPPYTIRNESPLYTSVEDETLSFKAVIGVCPCNPHYPWEYFQPRWKVELTTKDNTFYIKARQTGSICAGMIVPYIIEGKIKNIKPGNYTLKIGNSEKRFEIK